MFFSFRFPKGRHFEGIGLTYDDVLLVPKYNAQGSRRQVSTEQTDRSGKLSLAIPIITANMDTVTSFAMANFIGERGGIGALHRLMSVEKNVEAFKKCRYPAFVSLGCGDKGMARARAAFAVGARFFNLDIAHGHAKEMGETLRQLRREFGDVCIMAGNVATYSGAKFLYENGADLVKVGIGGGSVCTTRIKTGFGVSNISAIADCSRVKCSIVADGGIRTPADVVKALAFGADFVMLGGMLAGTGPTPGEVSEENGERFKVHRGLDSRETQMQWFGDVPAWRTPEGVTARVPYRDDEEAILAEVIGGLRSGLTYCGVSRIAELQRDFTYRIVSDQSFKEGLPHRLTAKGLGR